ncbi:MAG: ATP-binding protein [Acidimicrobiia bacterium]|nr:ATP-binding protein [Acidimicrobiia bacterium]MCY4457737.1 ATP-binding protein [Acidimicrobiaceae bacterium]
METQRPQEQPDKNPFSPSFGTVPVALVGRDAIFADLHEGLEVGPTDVRFTSLILGLRGSGKTAMLTEIEERVARNGWVVISVDGVADGLLDRVSEMIAQASRTYQTPGLDALSGARSTERERSVKVGFYHQAWIEKEIFYPNVNMGLRERLTLLAEVAQRADSGVLLTVDELHSANQDEARRLASDVQHITKRSRLPLAFVGAGLLEMKYTVMEGHKNTFFKRIRRYDLPPLTHGDALQGLRGPIHEMGGSIAKSALRLAASCVDGSPYKLQLIGHTAWQVANAPTNEIDELSVDLAIESAENTMLHNISEPAFYDLSNNEQEYLIALVTLGEKGTNSAIAQTTDTNERTTRRIARRLDLAGYIVRDSRGVAALTGLVPASVIIKEAGLDIEDTNVAPYGCSSAGTVSLSAVAVRPCREWMPRSQARCVLLLGHAGRCRSK